MARKNSLRTGWQYQSGTTACDSDMLLETDNKDLKKVVVIVNAPSEEIEDEQLPFTDSPFSFDVNLDDPLISPRSMTANLSPCSVLRELPSRQISFSQTDLHDGHGHGQDRRCSQKYQPKQKTSKVTLSHARKAMMSRGRDDLNANDIVVSILSNPNMNQAGLEANYERIETLRELNCSLTMKRKLKHNIGCKMDNQERPLVIKSPSLMFRCFTSCKKIRDWVKMAWTQVDMWRTQMIQLEGKYGSSTTYYFRFLHFLIILNLITFLITAAFVIAPQLLLRFFHWPVDLVNDRNATDNDLNLTTVLQFTPEDILKRSLNTYNLISSAISEINNDTISFQWTDIFTGAGYLSTTELYYGKYTNESISLAGNDSYNLPLAYFLVVIACLAMSLIVLVNRVAKTYKQYIVLNSGFGIHVYCNLVFSSWDFKIRSKKAAKLKLSGLRQEIEVKLVGLKNEANPMNSKEKFHKIIRHLFVHFIVFAILAGTATLLWFLLENNSLWTGTPVVDDLLVPIVTTVLLIVIPFTYTLLISWEKYINETTAIYVNMTRMLLLLVTVIGVLSYFWFRTNKYENSTTQSNNCWETRLGEEIYKLLIADLVIVNTLTFLASIVHRYCLFSILGFPEFNLAWHTWNLIYTQMLGWLGALFMPPVSGLVMIKLLLTFYLKQVYIRLICTPSARPWGASLTKTVFLSMAFMGLISTLIPVGYSIFVMSPSKVCGPFTAYANIYAVFNINVTSFAMIDNVFAFIMGLFQNPGIMAAIVVIMFAVAFQAKSYANTTKQLRERLRRQVILEGNDKVFLLNMLDGATKALETKRTSTCSQNVIEQRVFDFLKVEPLNHEKEKKPEEFSSQLSTFSPNKSENKKHKEFGSSSSEVSFTTCKETSPIEEDQKQPFIDVANV